MREIVVVSGKGGTGKTSLSASFGFLAGRAVVADCDVDAPDLHLLLSPEVRERRAFYSGREAVVNREKCIGCGACLAHCRYEAVRVPEKNPDADAFGIDPIACEGCGVCVRLCPVGAIDFPETCCGDLMVSDTRVGPMVHAQLRAAAENSGKLVAEVRKTARETAADRGLDVIVSDGPPGIGCPVIASLSGAWLAVAVSEPTPSGEHDLERVLRLAGHFKVAAAVCVNKWDVNPGYAERIEGMARERGAAVIGRVRYDPSVTAAQVRGLTPVEANAACSDDIRRVWSAVMERKD